MEEDLTTVYLSGIYDERDRWRKKIKEQLLKPMKEEHDKAITGFMKRDIPYCIEDGGIAQELGYFIGKIEELLEE
jgi:hypothetical protein